MAPSLEAVLLHLAHPAWSLRAVWLHSGKLPSTMGGSLSAQEFCWGKGELCLSLTEIQDKETVF